MIDKKVPCERYVNTWAPPRSVNRSQPKCEDGAERNYRVYDIDRLQTMLVGIKESFPDEKKVIIAAEPDVEFEAITDVMDTTRVI